MWKEQFRVVTLDATVPATPVAIEVIGYPPPALPFSILFTIAIGATGVDYVTQAITSLSKAATICSASVHRWNALGRDAIGVVLGSPIGADPTGSIAPLPTGAQNEQQYIHFDVPSRDLKHEISQANKTATAAGGVVYGTDFSSDLANVVLL